jgi:hypothetical protein
MERRSRNHGTPKLRDALSRIPGIPVQPAPSRIAPEPPPRRRRGGGWPATDPAWVTGQAHAAAGNQEARASSPRSQIKLHDLRGQRPGLRGGRHRRRGLSPCNPGGQPAGPILARIVPFLSPARRMRRAYEPCFQRVPDAGLLCWSRTSAGALVGTVAQPGYPCAVRPSQSLAGDRAGIPSGHRAPETVMRRVLSGFSACGERVAALSVKLK